MVCVGGEGAKGGVGLYYAKSGGKFNYHCGMCDHEWYNCLQQAAAAVWSIAVCWLGGHYFLLLHLSFFLHSPTKHIHPCSSLFFPVSTRMSAPQPLSMGLEATIFTCPFPLAAPRASRCSWRCAGGSTEFYCDLEEFTEVYKNLLRFTSIYWDLHKIYKRFTSNNGFISWFLLLFPRQPKPKNRPSFRQILMHLDIAAGAFLAIPPETYLTIQVHLYSFISFLPISSIFPLLSTPPLNPIYNGPSAFSTQINRWLLEYSFTSLLHLPTNSFPSPSIVFVTL